MSDLISRSALVDMLLTENQRCITSTGHEVTINMVVSFIKAQPTVYDIEEVVEDLDLHITKIVGRNAMLYKKIMEIVRNGGVE